MGNLSHRRRRLSSEGRGWISEAMHFGGGGGGEGIFFFPATAALRFVDASHVEDDGAERLN